MHAALSRTPAAALTDRDGVGGVASGLALLGASPEASQEEKGVAGDAHARVHHLLQIPGG